MIEFLQYLFAFIFALGLLITFHEYGHFLIARLFDVKILRFSVGFGRPLWKREFGEDQTELIIAALPLGGYVKMLDEREGTVPVGESHRAFNRKPLLQRFVIVLAGPLFNFIFAIFAYWMMFIVGLTGLKPVVGSVAPGSIADLSGLKPDQEIIAVESSKTTTWTMVVDMLIEHVIDGDTVQFTVRDKNLYEFKITINLQEVTIDDLAERGILDRMGIKPVQVKVPAVVGNVEKGLPADIAGFQPGDQILSADGVTISDWLEWVKYIREHPGENLKVEIQRNEILHYLTLQPETRKDDNGNSIGYIGLANQPPENLFARESYTFYPALVKAVGKTWDMSWLTLRMLGKMVVGEASLKNLSGPISIAQYAGDSAKNGLAAFLWFLGIVSVSLGVLNLLPIPVLDGGHLMFYLMEFLKGSPVSESTQVLGQQIGLAMLLGLMILVFYNDIMRLLG